MQIQKNISLKQYNTFQIDAKAKFFAEVKSKEEIQSLISNEVWTRYPHLILGGGANILFTKDYEGLVVKVSLLGKEIIEEKDGFVSVKAGAGEDWHETMMRMLEQGIVGCENLVYIP
ncbi:MAG: FAD-binding protein [bacterium]